MTCTGEMLVTCPVAYFIDIRYQHELSKEFLYRRAMNSGRSYETTLPD